MSQSGLRRGYHIGPEAGRCAAPRAHLASRNRSAPSRPAKGKHGGADLYKQPGKAASNNGSMEYFNWVRPLSLSKIDGAIQEDAWDECGHRHPSADAAARCPTRDESSIFGRFQGEDQGSATEIIAPGY